MMHAVFRDGSEVVLNWNVSSGMELSCPYCMDITGIDRVFETAKDYQYAVKTIRK